MSLQINKIFNDDYANIIKKIPKNSIDAIITDPPYGNFKKKTIYRKKSWKL